MVTRYRRYMASTSTARGRSPSSQAFEALSTGFRRQLLLSLHEANASHEDDGEPLVLDWSDADVERLVAVHTHLPKLDELGFIHWERETGTVTTGPNWDDIATFLRLLHDHRDDLPEGWLS